MKIQQIKKIAIVAFILIYIGSNVPQAQAETPFLVPEMELKIPKVERNTDLKLRITKKSKRPTQDVKVIQELEKYTLTGRFREQNPSCEILYFKPYHIIVEPGENAVFSWDTKECGAVGFDSRLVSSKGSISIGPLTTKTTYTLYAADTLPAGCQTFVGFSVSNGNPCAGNAVVKKVTIEVLSSHQYKCEIKSFTASPLFLGMFSNIAWDTKQCLHVGLNEGTSLVFTGIQVAPSGNRSVGPLTNTTSYRIVAASTLPQGCTTLVGYSPLTGEVCTNTAQTEVITIQK